MKIVDNQNPENNTPVQVCIDELLDNIKNGKVPVGEHKDDINFRDFKPKSRREPPPPLTPKPGAGLPEAVKTHRVPASTESLGKGFLERHRNEYIYRKERGEWWKLNNGIWMSADETAYNHMAALSAETHLFLNPSKSETPKAAHNKLFSYRHNEMALKRATKFMTAKAKSFDSCKHIAGLPDGRIVVLDTGVEEAAMPGDLLTRTLTCVPSHDEPQLWIQHLWEVLEPRYGEWTEEGEQTQEGREQTQEVIDWLQVFLGYCLTGETEAETFLFLEGVSGGGKSTFLEPIMHILGLGNYAVSTGPDALTSDGHHQHPERLARLEGARLIATTELKGRQWDSPLLNALVSGETITARHMYGSSFNFDPMAKLIVIGNEKPTATQVAGIWRRMALIDLTHPVPPEKRDLNRKSKLRAEASRILGWQIRGAMRYYRNGGLLPMPAKMREAVASYREEQNPLTLFLNDCYVSQKGECGQTFKQAYQFYLDWCSVNSEKRPVPRRWARQHFERYGVTVEKRGQNKLYLIDGFVQRSVPGLDG